MTPVSATTAPKAPIAGMSYQDDFSLVSTQEDYEAKKMACSIDAMMNGGTCEMCEG